MVRTRIAPSPTGYPHIGTIYQALFDYAFAKKHNGAFIVRIEDTDRTRFVADAEEKIFAALDWFGIAETESPRTGGAYAPYRQSERLDIYKKYALELVAKGKAYYCFCTAERLATMREILQKEKKQIMYDKFCRTLSQEEMQEKLAKQTPYVIRMKVPEQTAIIVRDEIRGEISFHSDMVDDQVLLKSDGFPTYHLAVVVDDHLMEITHMVRAEEWISSTPKHFLLYEYFGWDRPLFFHTSLLRNPDKSKLSKRHGHTDVVWYKENGYLPEAILNFLALLGWSHPDGKEIFPLSEFIALLELKDMKPVAPIFDVTKLTWMNQQYIMNMLPEELAEKLIAFYPELLQDKKSFVLQLMPLLQERLTTLKDFETLAMHFFEEPEVTCTNEQEKILAADLLSQLSNIPAWTKENIFAIMKQSMQKYGIRMPVLYRLLTGHEKGLPLPESVGLLGKEKTLRRLQSIQS